MMNTLAIKRGDHHLNDKEELNHVQSMAQRICMRGGKHTDNRRSDKAREEEEVAATSYGVDMEVEA